MYKTIVNGKEVTGAYAELAAMFKGMVGNPIERIGA